MRLVRKRSPVIAASSAVTDRLPGEHPAAGARPSPNAWPISAQGCDDAKGFGRILGLSVSFLNAENEEVLKNLLFILKAKIPLEFNLPVMDLKLLQTVEFFFCRGSRGNSLKRDFIANRVSVPEDPSQQCPYLAVGDRRGWGREVPQGTFLSRDVRRAHGGTCGCISARASLRGPDLRSASCRTFSPGRQAMLRARRDAALARGAARYSQGMRWMPGCHTGICTPSLT